MTTNLIIGIVIGLVGGGVAGYFIGHAHTREILVTKPPHCLATRADGQPCRSTVGLSAAGLCTVHARHVV